MIEVGKAAPAFTLLNQKDEKVQLTQLKGSWVVLYFYPRDDTPGCTTEAREFTALLPTFEAAGAVVFGISPDKTEKHRKFITKCSLGVTLLSDPEHAVMERYGAWGTKKIAGKTVVGTIRSTVLIDPKGKVAHQWTKVRAKGHAAKVLAQLEELQGARPS